METTDNTRPDELRVLVYRENYKALHIAMKDSKEFIVEVFDYRGKFKRCESDV